MARAIETFVAHAAAEALDKAVLRWLSLSNEFAFDAKVSDLAASCVTIVCRDR